MSLVVIAGCGDPAPDADAVAAAKCQIGVRERISSPPAASVKFQGLTVTDLGEGRREVVGRFDYDGAQQDFECVVAPDRSDKLRGLKVETLNLG